MSKYIRLVGLIVLAVLVLTVIMSASANNNDSDKTIVVDESTPDHVLLKDKEVKSFAPALKPSERLRVVIENVQSKVEVVPNEQDTVILRVRDANSQEINEIKSTYRKISGVSQIEISMSSAADTDQ